VRIERLPLFPLSTSMLVHEVSTDVVHATSTEALDIDIQYDHNDRATGGIVIWH
jgi:hypothetical protein